MVDEIVKNRPKTETDNFKSWFGESKAVNQDGEPLLLYHGTDSRFTKFASDGKAMWLSTELLYAREYSKPIKKSDEKVPSGKVFGGSIDRIIPAYIRAENPADFGNTHLSFEEALSDVSSKLDIPANELKSVWEKVGKPEKLWQVVNSSEMVDLLKEHGFDSIKAIEDTAPTWAVFESNQIKSAVANKGTFDSNKSDIRFSLSEDEKARLNKVTDDGLTMTYVRNPNSEASKYNYGSTYGQNIEPTGEYMNMDESQGKYKNEGWEYGTIRFKKPLVVEHINTSDTGWKKTVSDMYNGKTGKALTKALIKDGYDAIVTYDKYGYNEIVNLNGEKLNDLDKTKDLQSDSNGKELTKDKNGKYNSHKYSHAI